MTWQCPYCKTTDPRHEPKTAKLVCHNCRNYADAVKARNAEWAEMDLAQHYWCWPINWDAFTEWRNDPYYLRENSGVTL